MSMSDTLKVLRDLYHHAHSYKSEVDHFGQPVSDVVERLAASLTRAEELMYSLGDDCPTCNSANTKWLGKPPKGQIGTGPVYFKCLDCGRQWSVGMGEEEED
jgi:hypothetical protein